MGVYKSIQVRAISFYVIMRVTERFVFLGFPWGPSIGEHIPKEGGGATVAKLTLEGKFPQLALDRSQT